MKMHRWITFATLAVLGVLPVQAQQDEAKPVEAADLVRSPQNYWARSFVFADTLQSHPSGGALKLGGRRYVPFSVQEVGKCYVSAEMAHMIEAQSLNKPYHFMGTVLNQGGRYFIIVRGLSAAVEEGDLPLKWPEIVDSPANQMRKQALAPLRDILTLAESAQVAYANEKGVALSELFNPQSPHFAPAQGLIRSTIMAHEQKVKRPASEMLADYLFQILAGRNAVAEQAAEVAESPEAVPPSAPPEAPTAMETASEPSAPAIEIPQATEEPEAVEPKPAEEEAPRRLTRQERRELARQQKAAAKEKEQPLPAPSDVTIPEEPVPMLPAVEEPALGEAPPPAETPAATDIKPAEEAAPPRLTWKERRRIAREEKAEAAAEMPEAAETPAAPPSISKRKPVTAVPPPVTATEEASASADTEIPEEFQPVAP